MDHHLSALLFHRLFNCLYYLDMLFWKGEYKYDCGLLVGKIFVESSFDLFLCAVPASYAAQDHEKLQ